MALYSEVCAPAGRRGAALCGGAWAHGSAKELHRKSSHIEARVGIVIEAAKAVSPVMSRQPRIWLAIKRDSDENWMRMQTADYTVIIVVYEYFLDGCKKPATI